LSCYSNIDNLKLVVSFGPRYLYALAVAIMYVQNEIPDKNEDIFVLPSTQI